MEKRISKYIISIFALTTFATTGLYAQNNVSKTDKEKDTTPTISYPLMNGIEVGVDLWGPASKIFGSDYVSAEASVDMNLKNRYFPTLEIGYGKANCSNDYDTRYKASSPFLRIGADYNALYGKQHGNMLLIGLRYGLSSFKFDVDSPDITNESHENGVVPPGLNDPIWGDWHNYHHHGQKSSMHWFELCVGIRAHVAKNIYMGWALRVRHKLGGGSGDFGDPMYVPGYGRYKTNTLGVSYSIIYHIPMKSR